MKSRYLYGIILSSVLFVSCNNKEILKNENHNSEGIIKIESVTQNGFSSNVSSRSSYTINYATTFADGDQLGLILIDAEGNQTANAPYTFSGGQWSNNEIFYSPGIDKIIAYYPYNAALSRNITSVESLEDAITVATDQSDVAVFTQSDLLVCEINTPSANLNIDFNHAFSLISFSTSTSSVTVGDETFKFNLGLNGLSVSVGEVAYTPCLINGTYVCVLKNNTELGREEFRYAYSLGGAEANKTIINNFTTHAGTHYDFPCAASVEEGLSVGDFYCTSNQTGNVVIIPGAASALPEGLTCKGIVFHVMDEGEFGDFCTTNALTNTNYLGSNGQHGLIVSPNGGGSLGEPKPVDADIQTLFLTTENHGNVNLSNGYRLTDVIKTSTKSFTFTALNDHEETIQNATPWYCASFNELKYLIRGENYTAVSTLGQENINKQLDKIGGTRINGNIPSITSNDAGGLCIMENGNEMGWHGIPDEVFRPICAF